MKQTVEAIIGKKGTLPFYLSWLFFAREKRVASPLSPPTIY
jgi:hypothetical protein